MKKKTEKKKTKKRKMKKIWKKDKNENGDAGDW